MSENKSRKTLTDAEITTDRSEAPTGRRGFMGLMGAAGVGAALVSTGAQAQANTDSDDGRLADDGGCGRGLGGLRSGLTDGDNGTRYRDARGYGRGAPYC